MAYKKGEKEALRKIKERSTRELKTWITNISFKK